MKKEQISKRELRAKIKRNPRGVRAYLAAHPGAVAHFDKYIKKKIKEFLDADETDDEPAIVALDETLETAIDEGGDDSAEQENSDTVSGSDNVNPV